MLAKKPDKLAKKSLQHPKFSQWFRPQPAGTVNTRSMKPKLVEIPYRTERFARSPIPQLTHLLNKPNQS